MLEEPRELLARALAPLYPLELPPPKPLALEGLLFGMLWLPIRSPPPLPPRFAVLGPALPPRDPPAGC
jgi:hypothetical protein